MGEENLNDVDTLLKKVEEFTGTLSNLSESVSKFRSKLLEKKKKFGPDMEQWPEDK
ncbi:hypothetical protein ACFLZ2_00820 [Candidatus Margulisiibacteriota bacterium]